MDRNSFLKCQPYLSPLASLSWPPTLPHELSTGRIEISLRDSYYLSIEPIFEESRYSSNNSSSSIGESSAGGRPAFFRRPRQRSRSADEVNDDEFDDPAMCRFELACATINMSERSSPISGSRRFPTTTAATTTSPAYRCHYNEEKNVDDIQELAVFFAIDGRVYQADLTQVANVEVEHLQDEDGVSKPPSLLIEFSTCKFRIFSLDEFAADQFPLLDAMKTRISDAIDSARIGPFPAMTPTLGSPLGSSYKASNNEQAQRESARDISPFGKKNVDSTMEKQDSGETDDSADNFLSINRSRKSLQEARESLDMIQKVLELPVSSVSDSNVDLQDPFSKLLSSVPENLAASYCTQNQVKNALFHNNSKIKKYRVDLHDITRAFLPSARARKRARRSLNSEDSRVTPMEQTSQPPSAEECISKTKILLQRHKEALRKKYMLALLPTRG